MYLVCRDKIVIFNKKLVPLLNYIILLTIAKKQTGLPVQGRPAYLIISEVLNLFFYNLTIEIEIFSTVDFHVDKIADTRI